jgi:hypothetical protein
MRAGTEKVTFFSRSPIVPHSKSTEFEWPLVPVTIKGSSNFHVTLFLEGTGHQGP